MKKNICLLFGGKSCEHDISIITAMQIYNNLDEYLYNIYPIYVQKNGKMSYIKNMADYDFANCKEDKKNVVSFIVGDNNLYKLSFGKFKKWIEIDEEIIAMHGKNGEDGTMSALMNLCNIPHTSSDMIPSGICMDKDVFKRMLKSYDVPVVEGVEIRDKEFFENTESVLNKVEKELGFPVIVKPCNLGSSIGIKICHKRHDLANCIEFALKFDKKVLIEEFLDEIKEINVAVARFENEIVVSKLEQPMTKDDILSFENKYLSGGQKGGEFLKKKTEPKLAKKIKTEIVGIAKTVYEKLNFAGVVRFDFLIDKKTNNVFLNEANSIPGSFANYLFDMPFKEQLNLHIKQGFYDFQKRESLINSFESSVLSGVKFNKFNK